MWVIKKRNVKIALFSPPSFHDLACPGLTDMHVWWHNDSHTVRKSVQRPFRPPSLYAQSQKLTENEYFWFMPDGSCIFRAHLLVVWAVHGPVVDRHCMCACMWPSTCVRSLIVSQQVARVPTLRAQVAPATHAQRLAHTPTTRGCSS